MEQSGENLNDTGASQNEDHDDESEVHHGKIINSTEATIHSEDRIDKTDDTQEDTAAETFNDGIGPEDCANAEFRADEGSQEDDDDNVNVIHVSKADKDAPTEETPSAVQNRVSTKNSGKTTACLHKAGEYFKSTQAVLVVIRLVSISVRKIMPETNTFWLSYISNILIAGQLHCNGGKHDV